MNTGMVNLGERIKQKRKAASLTQEQLAERVGISQPSIFKIEQGKSDPSYGTLVALEKTLGPLHDEPSDRKFEVEEDVYNTIREPDFAIMFQMYKVMKTPKTEQNNALAHLIAEQLRLLAEAVRFCKTDAGEVWNVVRRSKALSGNPTGQKKKRVSAKK